MMACNAKHPEHPDVVCIEWLYHRSDDHVGYWPDMKWTPENELQWPVRPKAPVACFGCGAIDGHYMRCPEVFNAIR